MRAGFVVHHDGANGARTEFAADHRGGNISLFEVGKQVDIDEEPVGNDDQALDRPCQKHFEIALEAAALVVHIRENREVGNLIQRIFNTKEDQRAIRIRNIEKNKAKTEIEKKK